MADSREEFDRMAYRAGAKKKAAFWPTPIANDAKKRGNFDMMNPRNGLGAEVKREMWPTPTAHNAKETNAKSESERNTPTLAAQAGGSLNPTWVEWLMGWPLGWTDLKPSATANLPNARLSHGAPSPLALMEPSA
jgi:hypothetical protein